MAHRTSRTSAFPAPLSYHMTSVLSNGNRKIFIFQYDSSWNVAWKQLASIYRSGMKVFPCYLRVALVWKPASLNVQNTIFIFDVRLCSDKSRSTESAFVFPCSQLCIVNVKPFWQLCANKMQAVRVSVHKAVENFLRWSNGNISRVGRYEYSNWYLHSLLGFWR